MNRRELSGRSLRDRAQVRGANRHEQKRVVVGSPDPTTLLTEGLTSARMETFSRLRGTVGRPPHNVVTPYKNHSLGANRHINDSLRIDVP